MKFRTLFDIVAEVEANNVCEVSGDTLIRFFGDGEEYTQGLASFCGRFNYDRAQRCSPTYGDLCDVVVFYKVGDVRATDWQQAVGTPVTSVRAANLAAQEIEAKQPERLADA